ncbi:AAA family ATPase [Devosia sp. 2618]|uniref:AAA family ATPase n=1 Tax=Devosia sp. 2618 TaxID=3156454 RepID=UPI0033993C95
MRKVINAVTGGRARNVNDDMASLPIKVLASAVRQELTAGQCVDNLRRAIERQLKLAATYVTLLPGLPLTAPVRAWTDQVLHDLAAVQAGALPPKDIVFATLDGPPGTGKTLIAESLAHTAGWKFVPSSVGTWFTSGDGALGGVAKNLKSFMDATLASEPAIGFLDELDAIPNRATMDNRGRDWWTTIINLFLTEIDRVRKSNKKVLLLGATNYYDRLDDALVRPGRLQQRVRVLPPQSEDEVVAVLRHYLGAEIAASDLVKLARVGSGAVPAAVEGWVKEGRAAARLAGRPLAIGDLLSAMVPVDTRTSADIRAIAIHEAGHTVVAHSLGRKVESVSIIPEGESGGHTLIRFPTIVPVWTDLLDDVAVTLGGRAADIVLGKGANAGAEGDLAKATTRLIEGYASQGMRDNLVHGPALGVRNAEYRADVNADLKRQLARAISIIEAYHKVTLMLADKLIEQKVLVASEIIAVFEYCDAVSALTKSKRGWTEPQLLEIRAGI